MVLTGWGRAYKCRDYLYIVGKMVSLAQAGRPNSWVGGLAIGGFHCSMCILPRARSDWVPERGDRWGGVDVWMIVSTCKNPIPYSVVDVCQCMVRNSVLAKVIFWTQSCHCPTPAQPYCAAEGREHARMDGQPPEKGSSSQRARREHSIRSPSPTCRRLHTHTDVPGFRPLSSPCHDPYRHNLLLAKRDDTHTAHSQSAELPGQEV